MDISFADDDGSMEEIRPAVSLVQQKESIQKEEGEKKKEEEEVKKEEKCLEGSNARQPEGTTTSGGRFNPTEAILATMQLLPLPCAKVMAGRSGQPLPLVFMTAGEIERNVSLVRSYARGGRNQKSENNLAALALRRKSKSQMGLNEEGSPAAATTLTVRSGTRPPVPLCDQLDELRSFQRQLQNFPSLSELRRHPLVPSHQHNWLATTSSYSNNRRSLSPATSSRWLTDQGQSQDQPMASNVPIHQPSQSPISRSTSPSSCDESRSAGLNGRHQYKTESYALAILQILQVKKNNKILI